MLDVAPGMAFESTTRFRQHPNALFADLDGEVALFQSDTCDYLVLNETGSAIWAALAGQPTFAEICDSLQREYDVTPDDCRVGVESWLAIALERRVVDFLVNP